MRHRPLRLRSLSTARCRKRMSVVIGRHCLKSDMWADELVAHRFSASFSLLQRVVESELHRHGQKRPDTTFIAVVSGAYRGCGQRAIRKFHRPFDKVKSAGCDTWEFPLASAFRSFRRPCQEAVLMPKLPRDKNSAPSQ